MSVDIMADGTIGETTVVEEWGFIPIPGGSEGNGKVDGEYYGGWCGDGGRGSEGRCGIVEDTDN